MPWRHLELDCLREGKWRRAAGDRRRRTAGSRGLELAYDDSLVPPVHLHPACGLLGRRSPGTGRVRLSLAPGVGFKGIMGLVGPKGRRCLGQLVSGSRACAGRLASAWEIFEITNSTRFGSLSAREPCRAELELVHKSELFFSPSCSY
jgi:hypothetical protein